MLVVDLPRDKHPGSNYSYSEIAVKGLWQAQSDVDRWDYLAGIMLIWVSRYHGDSQLSVSRCRAGRTELKVGSIATDLCVARNLDLLAKTAWQPLSDDVSLMVHIGEFSSIEHRPELLLRQDEKGNLVLGFNREAYAQQTIVRMAGHLARILDADHTKVPVAQIPLLSTREYRQLIDDFNRTSEIAMVADPVSCLMDHCDANPAQRALIEGSIELNYQLLRQRVESLSGAIQSVGKSAPIVGVYLPRGIDTVVALFGVWHAGGVWLPLSTDYPESQLVHMCQESRVDLVVTLDSQDLSETMRRLPIIAIDQLAITNRSISRVPYQIDEVAAIMYTSGSTGLPNGVTHTHRALQNRFDFWLTHYPADSDDVFSQRTAITFIPSLWELVSGVMANRPLVIINDADSRNPKSLLTLVDQHRCTRLSLLPSYLRLILMSEREADVKLASVRLLITAGEPADAELVRSAQSLSGSVVVVNDYGCTETNGVLSTNSSVCQTMLRHLPAGRPINNCQAYILDELRQVVPIGVVGELYLAGLPLGEGYVNNTELTDAKYVHIALDTGTHKKRLVRVYRTHDRARWLPSGDIEVLGRCDNVVKVRGIRVELEAVEKSIASQSGIAEVAAGTVDDAAGKPRLVAWVVPAQGISPPAPSAIRESLLSKLPESAVPSAIYVVDALPRTANGKLARAQLKQLALRDRKLEAVPGARDITDDSELSRIVFVSLAATLECLPEELDEHTEFRLLGLDSSLAVEFTHLLSKALSREISVTLLFEATTIQSLTCRLQGGSPVDVPHNSNRTVCMDVAIVGIACRFPDAGDLQQFWRILKQGVNTVREIPCERWNWRDFFSMDASQPRSIVSKWGGFVEGIDQFDPLFFHVSANEARMMSPEQRLLLEACWQAVADAGYNEIALSGKAVGVYVGARTSDYAEHLNAAGIEPDAMTLLGNDNAILSARASYYLNLKGPVLTIDTACSSSLVAVHQACESLRRGECTMALAGGVSLVTSPTQYATNSKAGMLSPDGQCKAFDNAANGFVQGEGCGVVLLKPLDEAIKDGNRIYSVIKASGINQDGKTNGITAPSGESQRNLIQRVYQDSQLSPLKIGLMEAHGTGTKLGDPIEFQALKQVHRNWSQDEYYCALGSVKTNIGHLIAASGVAGLIKCALSLHHHFIPATLNYTAPNEHIELNNSPFYIPTEGRCWDTGNPGDRLAAVSSFGFSGTNCHLVLGECPAQATPSAEDGSKPDENHQAISPQKNNPHLFIFSAKSLNSLTAYATALDEYLAVSGENVCDAEREATSKAAVSVKGDTKGENIIANILRNIAGSLASRFNNFRYRAVICTSSISELRDALVAIAKRENHAAVLFSGEIGNALDSVEFIRFSDALLAEISENHRRMDKAWRKAFASLFANGICPDLSSFYKKQYGFSTVYLPPYQFDHKRYWVSDYKLTNEPTRSQVAVSVAPILSANHVPQPVQQVDSSTKRIIFAFNRSHFVGHQVHGQVLLPAAAQIEQLRQAVCVDSSQSLTLRDWHLHMAVIFEDEQVELSLDVQQTEIANEGRFRWMNGQRLISAGHWQRSDRVSVSQQRPKLQISTVIETMPVQRKKSEFYASCAERQLHYTEGYQRIQQIRYSHDTVVALVALPASISDKACDYQTELLDGALQSLIVLSPQDQCWVPTGISSLRLGDVLPGRFVAVARLAPKDETTKSEVLQASVHLYRLDGSWLMSAQGVHLKSLGGDIMPPSVTTPQEAHRSVNSTFSDSPCSLHCWEKRYIDVEIHSGQTRDKLATELEVGLFAGSPPVLPDDVRLLALSTEDCLDGKACGDTVPRHWLWQPADLSLQYLLEQFVTCARYLLKYSPDARWLILDDGSNPDVVVLAAAARSLVREVTTLQCCVVTLDAGQAAPLDEFFADTNGWVGRRKLQRTQLYWQKSSDDQWPEPSVDDADVVLVVGGLGGIGRQIAQWHMINGMAKLVLLGRRSPSTAEQHWIRQCRKLGHEVVYLRADLSLTESASRVVRQIILRFGRLDIVYYCAGVTRDALLRNKDKQQIADVLAAKQFSLLNLDNALACQALKQWFLFSSVSAATGTVGQIDYAAANAWMDQFAQKRNACADRQGHCVSVNWGLWQDGGMRPGERESERLLYTVGMQAMPSNAAFRKLHQLAEQQIDQAAVLQGDFRKLDAWLNNYFEPQLDAVVGELA